MCSDNYITWTLKYKFNRWIIQLVLVSLLNLVVDIYEYNY